MKHQQCNCVDQKTSHCCNQNIPLYSCIPCHTNELCGQGVHCCYPPYSYQESDESETESEEEYDDRKPPPSVLLQIALDAIEGIVLIMALRIIARI